MVPKFIAKHQILKQIQYNDYPTHTGLIGFAALYKHATMSMMSFLNMNIHLLLKSKPVYVKNMTFREKK